MNEQSEQNNQEDGRPVAGAPHLTTSRLILRAPRAQDARAIAAIANNRRIAEQTRRMPHPYGVENALAWIETAVAGDECKFLVIRKSDNTILGAAGCAAMDERDTEIGFWIGEPFWGNGFATEAAQAVIDHIFAIPSAGAAVWPVPGCQYPLARGADEMRVSACRYGDVRQRGSERAGSGGGMRSGALGLGEPETLGREMNYCTGLHQTNGERLRRLWRAGRPVYDMAMSLRIRVLS